MIAGLTGAGKSTYAERLAVEFQAVRLSLDEWNATLFFPDRDPASDFDWFYERVQRCAAQMRATAEQILRAGTAVIFDCGFTNRAERQIFYDWANARNYSVQLHYLDVSPQIRWQRTERRNAEKGATYALHVSREMFDFMHTIWEAPETEELVAYSGLVVGGSEG